MHETKAGSALTRHSGKRYAGFVITGRVAKSIQMPGNQCQMLFAVYFTVT